MLSRDEVVLSQAIIFTKCVVRGFLWIWNCFLDCLKGILQCYRSAHRFLVHQPTESVHRAINSQALSHIYLFRHYSNIFYSKKLAYSSSSFVLIGCLTIIVSVIYSASLFQNTLRFCLVSDYDVPIWVLIILYLILTHKFFLLSFYFISLIHGKIRSEKLSIFSEIYMFQLFSVLVLKWCSWVNKTNIIFLSFSSLLVCECIKCFCRWCLSLTTAQFLRHNHSINPLLSLTRQIILSCDFSRHLGHFSI